MTKPLSPAAQAVVDAWNAKHNPYGLTYRTHAPEREALAAALRAAADQVVPEEVNEVSDQDDAVVEARRDQRIGIRCKFRAIAAELDPTTNTM